MFKKLLPVVVCVALLSACGGVSSQAQADYEMAYKYMSGDGVEKDQSKAIELLTKAADGGSPDAMVALGFYYMKGENGVEQDMAKGFELFTKAAERGDRDAQYNLGLAYVRAQGTPQDFAKAFKWFEKAAYQDDGGAQYNVGVMYFSGEGVEKDMLQSYIWFSLADAEGYIGAKEAMEEVRGQLTAEEVEKVAPTLQKVQSKIKTPPAPAPLPVSNPTTSTTPL